MASSKLLATSPQTVTLLRARLEPITVLALKHARRRARQPASDPILQAYALTSDWELNRIPYSVNLTE